MLLHTFSRKLCFVPSLVSICSRLGRVLECSTFTSLEKPAMVGTALLKVCATSPSATAAQSRLRMLSMPAEEARLDDGARTTDGRATSLCCRAARTGETWAKASLDVLQSHKSMLYCQQYSYMTASSNFKLVGI